MRCLRTSLLGPSDLTSLDLENDLSLRWAFQITPGLLFFAIPIAASYRSPLPLLANCFFEQDPFPILYGFRQTFLPQIPILVLRQMHLWSTVREGCSLLPRCLTLLPPQATLPHLGTELLGFLTHRGPTNAGKLSDDPLKISERRLGQEVAHIPITQKSFQKSHILHLFHPAFKWGTFR